MGEVDEILISSDRVEMMLGIKCNFTQGTTLPTGRSVVECRTHNRDSPGLNPPFAIVFKFGHFRSLHDASVHSAVEMSTWL